MNSPNPFAPETILADAQRKESLTDWGPGDFHAPLEVLLADYARADLNAVGTHILRSGLVHSLRMRLRTQEWIRRHPEILDERIAPPIVVVGMMRSGTTLLQRLLAADPRFLCAYGWEVVEAAPKLDYRFGGTDPRVAISAAREAKTRELAPELFTIHPMYARDGQFCKLCLTCLKACPHESARLFVRLPLAGLTRRGSQSQALVPLSLVVFFLSLVMLASRRLTWLAGPAEYTAAVLKNKAEKSLFITFINHVSPACDCVPYNDAPIVRDIGVVASADPVAIDQASIDLVNNEPALPHTCLETHTGPGDDKFKGVYPHVDWEHQLVYAEKIGLGTRKYELIKV